MRLAYFQANLVRPARQLADLAEDQLVGIGVVRRVEVQAFPGSRQAQIAAVVAGLFGQSQGDAFSVEQDPPLGRIGVSGQFIGDWRRQIRKRLADHRDGGVVALGAVAVVGVEQGRPTVHGLGREFLPEGHGTGIQADGAGAEVLAQQVADFAFVEVFQDLLQQLVGVESGPAQVDAL